MTGRVAIVTGGTGALGQCVSRALLAAGATLCVPWVVSGELETLRASLDRTAAARLHTDFVDVTREAAFAGFVRKIVEDHRRVDVLVNAVGGFAPGDLASTTLEAWNRMLELNLTSAMIGCRAVLPTMTAAGAGRIVNVASRAVVPPLGGFIGYTVAKAGVITLTQALAREVARGITVNAVLPSTMDTPANREAMPDADRSGWVRPEAVADVIAYLASDEAAMITGATIPV